MLWGKDALSSKVKKDNCWSEQSPEKSTVPFLLGPPGIGFLLIDNAWHSWQQKAMLISQRK